MSVPGLSVAVVEDHGAIREALVLLLRADGLHVAGCAARADEAYDLIMRRRPDVAIIDIRLGEDSGIDLTRRLLERLPALPVLLYTGEPLEAGIVEGVLRCGARGIALKSGDARDLTEGIARVASGQRYVDPRLRAPSGREVAGPVAELSEREREILLLISEGLSSEAIAVQLYLSPHTVRTHVRNIMGKLGVHTRAQAVLMLERAGGLARLRE